MNARLIESGELVEAQVLTAPELADEPGDLQNALRWEEVRAYRDGVGVEAHAFKEARMPHHRARFTPLGRWNVARFAVDGLGVGAPVASGDARGPGVPGMSGGATQPPAQLPAQVGHCLVAWAARRGSLNTIGRRHLRMTVATGASVGFGWG
jgi:hypothetical protein